MFTAVLFTIAKTRKKHKCPSAEERIKKMWYMYITEYYLAIEKNEIMQSVAKWRNLEICIPRDLSEGSQTRRNLI